MKQLTLQETTETLILWCNSCQTDQQLVLLDSLIDRFLINRFRGDLELANEVSKVLVALQDRSKKLLNPATELNMN